MPWYAPWSDHIAKRVCKYLLQRYLGQFLEEKLTLDQLTVDLYKGLGTICNVALDVQALNDLAEQQNIPFEFLDGFIEQMSVSVPWHSILHDASYIEVRGLALTIKHKERDKSRASMFESMWSSMTSSMQLAEDCLKKEKEELSEDTNQSFEGIERFAQTIDSILSRIKVKFLKTVIRLEQVPPNGNSGIALEVDIKSMDYFDEAGVDVRQDIKEDFQLPAFSTKKLYLEGITLYSDEFPVNVKNTSENENSDDKSNNSDYESNNILLGRLAGRQEITMKFKQEGIIGPKVELQVSLGALTLFASPRQAHNMMDLINGMTTCNVESSNGVVKNRCSEKPMEESDFRKIEQELQLGLNPISVFHGKGLINQGWGNTSFDGSDDEFAPLQNSSKLNDSVMTSGTSLSSSTSSVSSGKSSPSQSQAYQSSKKKSHSAGIAEADPNTAVFHFHVLLSSLAIVLLHDDILTMSVDSHKSVVTKSSFKQMYRLAEDFFAKLGHFAVSGYGNKDFSDARQIFLNACQLNHLRFLAAPVIIEGNEISSPHSSVIKGNCTAASMEILECLIEKETHSQKGAVEHVELLKFTKQSSAENKDGNHIFESQPGLKVNFKLSQTTSRLEKGRRLIHPKSDFSFVLQPFETEIDVTIIDRISALLNPENFWRTNNNAQKPFSRSHFEQAVETHTTLSTKQDIKISSSFATLKVRFPIPDLRPIHDMDKPPWWRRSVRQDVLYLDVTDFSLHTVLDDQDSVSKYETQFRDVVARFKEADSDTAIPFARASADPNCDTILDGGQGFGWPRLVVQVFPKMSPTALEENEPSLTNFKFNHSLGHQSLVTTLENTTKKKPSPFSCKKVVHESDTPHSKASSSEQMEGELVIPGDKSEIADFIDVASVNTKIKLDISLPTVSVVFPSKHLYEVIYNRISNDLLLWEPSAPVREAHSVNNDVSFQEPMANIFPTFSLCKSGIRCESDSDSESQEGIFYSVHEQKKMHKKKQLLQNNTLVGQSKIVIHLTVAQGLCDLFAPARDAQGNVIPGQHGQLYSTIDEGSLFLVSGYKGKPDLDYMCIQVNHFSFYHNGLVSDAMEKPTLRTVGSNIPSYLDATVYKTEKTALIDQTGTVGVGSSSSMDMLTVSVRIQKDESTHSLKMFRVATGIRNATLRHIVCNGQTSWFTQLIDFFDVDDYPVAGYEPSSVLTEINLHLWNCSIDYRPLYLPIRSVLTVGNFNISSNIAAQTNSSTLRFIAEDAAFFISDKTGVRFKDSPIDLRRDYVCIMDLGLFELSLRLCEKNPQQPKIDLRASTNVAHIWTCADSAKAVTELLMYFASDGDLTFNETENEEFVRSNVTDSVSEEQVLVKTVESENVNVLSKSQVALVNDLMEEAMKESKVESNCSNGNGSANNKKKGNKVIYFECDEEDEELMNGVKNVSLGSELKTKDESDEIDEYGEDTDNDSWEKEFCILDNEAGIGILPKKGLPEVRNLTNAPVRLVDNHFSIPLGKADLLRSPKHYPKPVLRYMLREMSVIWHMYGGSDFDNTPSQGTKHLKIDQHPGSSHSDVPFNNTTTITFSKNAPKGIKFETTSNETPFSWKEKGGPKRRHDILMELQLNKVRFQHEVYPENTAEASRQVLLIQEVEIRDRLATSTINKFLYQYSSEAKPKQSQAPMVVVKAVLMRSDPKGHAQECCLKVSLLPLRLNIDQDSILFLYSFFTELSGDCKEEEEDSSSRVQSPTHQVPVMSVNVQGKPNPTQPETQHLLIELEEENQRKSNMKSKAKKKFPVSNKPPTPPIFFRCFIFSPEVPVKLDYQGKRVDMTHGPLAGILMGLGQLNNSELRLRKISHRHGLLGFDKLLNFVLSEWTNDIKKNQLPSLLGGVGPMHSLVQLIQGIRDLFWLPIEQYQRDGRLVRGFQRGANSFTTSTAMACLELTSRVIQIIQTTAETAYDMVSPGPSVRTRRRGKGRPRRYAQPADIREGVANAYLVVKEGIGETAETIVRVASEEHEQKGVTGAVGGVLRQIPPTVVKPIILATEATNNVIGGMRSQLVPDARKEAVEKWRKQDL